MSLAETANDVVGKDAVVTAIDFSVHSKAALIWACRYADAMDVPIIALHIVHEPANMPGFYRRDKENPLRPIRETAEIMMGEFLEQVGEENPDAPGLDKVQTLLIEGLIVDRILEASEKLQAGLLVMGSFGLTGLSQLLLGSHVEELVQRSRMPVTIVKIPENPAAEE